MHFFVIYFSIVELMIVFFSFWSCQIDEPTDEDYANGNSNYDYDSYENNKDGTLPDTTTQTVVTGNLTFQQNEQQVESSTLITPVESKTIQIPSVELPAIVEQGTNLLFN